jgi:ferrous iron transport protein B
LIFQFVFRIGEYPMHWLEVFFGCLGNIAGMIIENETIRSLVVDGIIAGVGGVLVFLPNILLLFFALAFFEGSGYMARAAFVVDKVMHVFGLHGKSAISMITGFGCSVPAFMSTRTLKSKSDRITTMLIIPFMSCGAKLPVYILIIGAFFHPAAAANALFGIYIFGVIIALFSALLFKSTIFKGKSEPFVMELPPYRMPSGQSMFFQMWRHAAEYLKKAGTIILIASVLIWLGSNYPQSKELVARYEKERTILAENKSIPEEQKTIQKEILNKEEASQQIRHSLVGSLGIAVEPVIKPLGFDWRIGISLITGIIGKEVVVSTMSTLYALGENDPGNIGSLQKKLSEEPEYDLAMAIALLIFVLLYVPCIAASIVFHREAGAWKYTLVYIAYSIGIAWLLAFAGYNITLLFL